MEKFAIDFELLQHTPHIHFQHQQAGATLRGTELKPKLDSFLINKLGKNAIKKEWMVGGKPKEDGSFALSYKTSIKAEEDLSKASIEEIEEPKRQRYSSQFDLDREGKPKVLSFPGYFGNLGLDIREDEALKKFVSYDTLKLSFFSHHPKLIDLIIEHFPEFLATHNFGNRQSKGFGSYYLKEKKLVDQNPVNKFIKYHFSINASKVSLPNYAHFHNRSEEYITFYKLFYALNLLYSSMRSGINFGGLYFKSLIFMYAKAKGIQWDKKTIRDKFHLFTDTYREAQRKRTDPNGTFLFSAKEKRMMRDILGLSTEQSWLSYRDVITKEGVEKNKGEQKFARFKSPITFKIVREAPNGPVFQIFVHPEKIPEDYFGAEFEITSKWNKKHGILRMKLPTKEEFQLTDFLEFCFKRVFKNDGDFDKHVDNSSSPEARLLKDIYSQLRNC